MVFPVTAVTEKSRVVTKKIEILILNSKFP
jgi:hypothetical protein